MDSLTQIVLGAACGEAVLGKKIGNKALLFGAIGGTIPDLDVYIGPWLYDNEIQSMVFHRGIMHSILFALMTSISLGYLSFKLYNNGKRKNKTDLRDWILLFFWALITHSFLDCFTPYGTQLFAPFSDYRVAFNTISVVDPLYTLPFLICMIVLMFFKRNSIRRRTWLKLGLGLSTSYLILTIGNKFYMDSVFKNSLADDGIEYKRFRVQPTILNNILWYGIAETDDHYYGGFYSIFDSSDKITKWSKFPKNHDLVSKDNPNMALLTWFSDDYYNLFNTDKKLEYRYNDLRYPSLDPNEAHNAIFSFRLITEKDMFNVESFGDRDPSVEEINKFIERIKGI